MPLETEYLPGHRVTVDAESDPEHVSLTCSCGELDWKGGPTSGESLIESCEVLRSHLAEHGQKYSPQADQITAVYAGLFDVLYPDSK